MTHGHPEKFWFVLPGAGYHFLRFPRILNREPDLRTTALGRIMCTVLELVRGGESAFFSCSLCQGSRVTVEATYPQIPSPTHVWVMSEASHFQAGLTVGSSSPKCKPWGLECLPCTSPPAKWSTCSFRVPTASNQGISESLPFFLLLWSFSLPQSASVYSHLRGVYLFSYSILKTSDGVSTEMHSCDSSTREGQMSMSCFSFQGRSYMTPMHQLVQVLQHH